MLIQLRRVAVLGQKLSHERMSFSSQPPAVRWLYLQQVGLSASGWPTTGRRSVVVVMLFSDSESGRGHVFTTARARVAHDDKDGRSA